MTTTFAELRQFLEAAGVKTLDDEIRVQRTEGALPASFAQQRLWFLSQLEPQSAAYNCPIALRLHGPLDVRALESALRDIVSRHEVLRTRIATRNGEPVQEIVETVAVSLPVEEVAGETLEQREAAVQEAIAAEARRPFALAQDVLLRLRLLRLDVEDHVLAITLHHIVADAWSLGVLTRELTTLYAGYREGRRAALPALSVQYADYAHWQRQWLTGAVLERHLAYWRGQLADVPTLALPTDASRPAIGSGYGATLRFSVGEELTRRLRDIGREEGVTLFMTLLAGLQIVLGRYANQEVFAIGTAIAGRTRAEIEPLIGFFVNMLPLRADLRGNPTFRELLQRVRETCLGAYAHQDLPFERLVEELQPERDASRAPLFQVTFGVQNVPLTELQLSDLRVERVLVKSETTKYDLTLMFAERGEQLEGYLQYATDLFTTPAMERLVRHLVEALEVLAARSTEPVQELSWLTAAEQAQLRAWNATAAEYPTGVCVHELIEAQVERTPDAVAVRDEAGALSYAQLNRRANRLARRLVALGVDADKRVALCLGRSAEMVVAILAVWKAGGAYVPIDPQYPAARRAYMVADSGAEVLLHDGSVEDWEVPSRTRVVRVQDAATVSTEADGNLARRSGPQHLAYVIYTSGSTGRPKGVMVPHRNVTNLCSFTSQVWKVTSADCVSVPVSWSFDASVEELMPALSAGAAIAIYELDGTTKDGLEEFCTRHQVTIVHAPTGYLRHVARASESPSDRIRLVICGGETVLAEDLRIYAGRWPAAAIRNEYGPTESTITACAYAVQGAPKDPVLIGQPQQNVTVHVLDGRGRVVPVGAVGELYIGGAGVARGYVGQAGLTAERFVPDGFSGEPGARLYRTGDLVRWRGDGALEYLGRIDTQVKLRGHRIELGEIEAVLQQHEAVTQAVVVLQEQLPVRRLVAAVVSRAGEQLQPLMLRRWLEGRLPHYMVPAAIVQIERIPLTVNGKVDRQALQRMVVEEEPSEQYVAPRTAVEEVLVGIWQDVLGVRPVGVEDNFFERGGHSLLATQVIGRVREVLQREIPLRMIFEAPTVRALADHIEPLLREGEAVPPIRVERGEGALPASFAQQRLWFLSQLEPQSAAYNCPIALRLHGPLDVRALESALRDIVSRHEVLRTRIATRNGEPVQEIVETVAVSLPVEEVAGETLEQREAAVQEAIAAEARRPFALAQDVLLRLRLLRLDVEDHVLAITLHHIVADAWSLGVLTRELTTLYAGYREGRRAALPALSVQYADYAHWQRQWLTGAVLERHLAYWRGQLADVPTLALPTDASRPAIGSGYGATLRFSVGEELTRRLRDIGREEGVTLFMTLLAGLQIVLGRYANQEVFAIGTAIAGRTRAEIEPLIGFFVNMLPLRADLRGNPTFRELLQRVRETCLGAYAHQDLPFERLVEELQPERDASRAPLFQVTFGVQNVPLTELQLSDLRVERVLVKSETTKYDLTLMFAERGEQLEGYLQYATDLFTTPAMERLVRHLVEALEVLAARSTEPVQELSWLTAAEQAQLRAWNATAAEYPRDCSVGEMFEAQVAIHPAAVALQLDDQKISYAALNERANRIAGALGDLGVCVGGRVGVCLVRGIDLIAALVGITKAGGAYVAVDPTDPPARISAMFSDARVAVVVHDHSPLPEVLKDYSTLNVTELSTRRTENPGHRVPPESLLYVAFTSGTTGRPKGAAIPHRAVLRLLFGQSFLPYGPDLVVLQLAPVNFDASTFEIWGTLLHGGRLVISPEPLPLAVELSRVIAECAVNTLWLTASLYNSIIDQSPAALGQIRHLLVGGEPLSVPHIREGMAHMAHTVFMNGYGPTENTTFTCCYEIPRDLPLEATSIPIGTPLANTQAYVVDENDQLLPPGIIGELLIGGEGLAQGYVSAAAETATRFIPDHLSGAVGARLYRSGDMVRWRSDGHLEFKGRKDTQIKLRGHRIELGEVETVLRRHEAVAEVVTSLQEDGGRRRLVAFVSGYGPLSGSALRSWLGARLPDYMVPAAIVQIERIPLTVNGKVDRQALQRMVVEEEPSEQYVAPRTAVEEVLVGIWQDVLGVRPVGVEDNFFERGGHSLLATQVIGRVREVLQREIPLRMIFEAPTVRALADHIEPLLREGEAVPPIRVERGEGALPASFAQQRLWFLSQLEPQSAAYNCPIALRLHGPLDVRALESALRDIVSRHEVLRTRIATRNGEPVQEIVETVAVSLPVEEVAGETLEQREAAVQEAIAAEARRPFALAQDVLLRLRLLRLDVEDHVLAITLHHIVADAWSLGVLTRELTTLYAGYREGRRAALPALSVQYADYAHWQRQWLTGAVLERHLAYWRGQLADVPTLALPTDASRPAIGSGYGATLRFSVGEELTRRLRDIGREEGVTLFMTLLAGLQIVLGRYANQEVFAIGTAIAGRTRAEIEPLIGFFVNMLPLRADLRGNPTFRELLQRVRETCLGAYAHQDLPFERLVEELQPERDASRAPLFQVTFGVQNVPLTELQLSDLRVERVLVKSETTKYDLTLMFAERGEQLEGYLQYATDLFTTPAMERLVRHLVEALEVLAARSTEPVQELSWLTAAEQAQLRAWNATAAEYPTGVCVHELIEAQVERTPDAVAVRDEAGALSYAQLNRRANRLARRLVALGVDADKRVALCLGRSAEMVVAILAVWKAGGAYVPIDPQYPAARRAYMVADSGAEVLLHDGSVEDWEVPSRTRVVRVQDAATVSTEADGNLARRSGPQHLAYVIYTSGSTGRPKGVMVPHRNVTNLCSFTSQVWKVTSADCVSVPVSWSFDASVEELMPALSAGAAIAIYELDGTTKDGLEEFCTRHQVTIVHAPTGYLRHVARASESPSDRIRLVICGGETVLAEDLRIYAGRWPAAAIRNEYGPTESTITACAYAVQGAPKDPVLIGQPQQNVTVHVLDGRGRVVPVGAVGELYIGGAGVARGYVGQAGLTAERFVPDGFSGEPGARLYRTGDLVRWRGDGALEYLGRIDTQVKLRGHRIELGEIEAVLQQHEAVTQAVVVLQEQLPVRRLVAAVVSRAGEQLQPLMLRRWLEGRLPHYMVPAAIVQIERIPLTVNGKVDRQALQRMVVEEEPSEQYVAPRTAVEEVLVGIWQDVLGVRPVGVEDNFFERGGDSILSIQVVARAKQVGVGLSVRQLFEHQTIAALAPVAESVTALLVEQGAVSGSIPLTPIQRWFVEQAPAVASHFNQAQLLEVDRAITPEQMAEAWKYLLEHHDALRMRFRCVDGAWCQEVVSGDTLVFSYQSLVHLDEAAQHRALETEAERLQASLDLTAGPLVRVAYFDSGVALPARVVVVIHHLVVDAVSWRVLLEDLRTLCEALGRKEQPRLPSKTTSYAAWTRALAVWARSAEAGEGLAYWMEVAGTPACRLPVDWGEGANTVESSSTVMVTVDEAQTTALLALPRRSRSTVHEVLLTAVARAVAEYSGSDVVRIDVEGHGREEVIGVDVTRTVGWFTTLYPLAIRVSDVNTDKLGEVTQQLRRVPQNGIGYGVLRYLAADPKVRAKLAAVSPADVCFNYFGHFRGRAHATLRSAYGRIGRSISAQHQRPYLLDINSEIRDGQLRIRWTYSKNRHKPSSIEAIAGRCLKTLREVIADTEQRAPTYAGADFPLAALTASDLERVVAAARGRVIESVYPASPVQQGMVLYGLQQPGAHVEQGMYLLEGELDVAAFERSWHHVVHRHGALRSLFVWDGVTRPVQVVLRDVACECRWEDWRGLSTAEQASRWTLWMEKDRARGFAVDVAPLVRVSGIRLGDVTTRLIVTSHHAIWDGWSSRIVLREVFETYEAYRQHREPQLPACGSFERYIAWLAAQPAQEAEKFWTSVVGNLMKPTQIPAQRRRSGPAAYATVARTASREVSRQLQRRCRAYGWTPASVVQGVWGLVLGTWGRGQDAVFGITVSTRPEAVPHVERTVGPFINTVPLRWRWDGAQPIAKALGEFQAHQAQVQHYSYAPLLDIHRHSQLEANQPLFESLVVFQNYPAIPLPSELHISEAGAPPQTQHPLTLLAHNRPQLRVRLIHDVTRVSVAVAEEIVAAFLTVLEQVVADPSQPMEKILQVVRWTPLPPDELAESPATYVAPRTPIEEILVSVWQEVLGRPVGVEDNFFDHGGHSLLATQAIGRLRQVLQRDIPLRLLFEAPTARTLAAGIERLVRGGISTPSIGQRSRRDDLQLSFAQKRLWFLNQLEPQSAAYNCPIALRLQGALHVTALENAFREIVARHEVLRTRIRNHGGYPALQIVDESSLKLVAERVSGQTSGERDAHLQVLIKAEVERPFNMDADSLMRIRLLQLETDDHVLLINMHHVITDAWSLGVFTRELTALYHDFSGGQRSSLPALPVQYADYAQWQHQWLAGAALERHLAFWRSCLTDVPPLALPSQAARRRAGNGDGTTLHIIVPATLVRRLRILSQAEGVTLFMTLLAGLQVVLGRLADQERFAIGTAIAGRTHAETEPLIGFFVNMLPLTADLRGNPTFRELVRRVREICLGAYAHQDLPFDVLVEEMHPERDPGRAPLFQVTFGLQNSPRAVLALPALRVSTIPLLPPSTRYDLAIWAVDRLDDVQLVWTFPSDFFRIEMIQQVMEEFIAVLEAVATQPEVRLNALEPIAYYVNPKRQRERLSNRERLLSRKS